MRAAGLDVGSRTVELVVIDAAGGAGDGPVVEPFADVAAPPVVSSVRIDTTPRVASECRLLLDAAEFDRLVVTGYGRSLAEGLVAVGRDAPTVTEIKAHARGAHAVRPGCRTVLDIGGQDTKAMALDGRGRAVRFEMNDRCAAGAGRFLEIMAKALDYDLGGFGAAALEGRDDVALSSTCAVFAESEVVGLVTRGVAREDIARAVHRAIVRRTVAMLERVGVEPPVLFAGGAASDGCLVAMLEEALGREVTVPEDPHATGALGAALIAAESAG